MERVNFFDHAGLMTTQGGILLSTHVGDGLELYGFQEGANPPGSDVIARSAHPVFSPSVQLAGAVLLVAAVLYLDHRIKVKI